MTTALATRAVSEVTAAAFDHGMTLRAELTGHLTSEFAFRILLKADPHRALSIIDTWTDAGDVDIRRLTSEGSRRHLPWSARVPMIIARPDSTTGILDRLYKGPTDYVRRSLANHLNDIRCHAPSSPQTVEYDIVLPLERDEAAVISGLLPLRRTASS